MSHYKLVNCKSVRNVFLSVRSLSHLLEAKLQNCSQIFNVNKKAPFLSSQIQVIEWQCHRSVLVNDEKFFLSFPLLSRKSSQCVNVNGIAIYIGAGGGGGRLLSSSPFQRGNSLIKIIANSHLRHGLEFDCDQEAIPFRGARLQFKFHLATISSNDTDTSGYFFPIRITKFCANRPIEFLVSHRNRFSEKGWTAAEH